MFFRSTIGTENKAARDVWLKDILLKLPPGSKILDAGAGECRNKELCNHLDYISQDFCQYEGKGDGAGLQRKSWNTSCIDIISDITAIPVQDSTFDAILCTEVFEHIPEPIEALKEFSRLLKSGGRLILTAPFCSLTHMAPYHFYSGFNSYFYQHHFPKYGFEIIEMEANGNWFSYLAQEIRRIPTFSGKYAKKFKVNRIWRLIIRLILYFIERIEAKEALSSELLCYGYHVFAKKVSIASK